MRSEYNRKHGLTALFKKIAAFSLCMVMVLLCACNFGDYRKARSEIVNGNYKEAIDIFSELGDYKDSREEMLFCEAMLHIEKEEYKEAFEIKGSIKKRMLVERIDIPLKAI